MYGENGVFFRGLGLLMKRRVAGGIAGLPILDANICPGYTDPDAIFANTATIVRDKELAPLTPLVRTSHCPLARFKILRGV